MIDDNFVLVLTTQLGRLIRAIRTVSTSITNVIVVNTLPVSAAKLRRCALYSSTTKIKPNQTHIKYNYYYLAMPCKCDMYHVHCHSVCLTHNLTANQRVC